LTDLKELYNKISKIAGKGKITVDLGMVNKTDYYTGVIIRGYLEGYGEEVLSGGRYDKLIADFGYDIPATGFAVNVDAVMSVEMKKNSVTDKNIDAIIYAENGFEIEALHTADKLRQEGSTAELSLFDTIEETIAYAKAKNIAKIIKVNEIVTEVE